MFIKTINNYKPVIKEGLEIYYDEENGKPLVFLFNEYKLKECVI